MTWGDVKEVFFTIGSIAGVIALVRPLLEDKMRRDDARIQHVKELLPEQDLLNLEYWVWSSRSVPEETFGRLDRLSHQLDTKQDCVRFNGPNAKFLKAAAVDIASIYSRLRKYIQVPQWEPRMQPGGETLWVFNKAVFEDSDGVPQGYDAHLKDAAKCALELTLAFQRFQIVSELHLFEIPFAKWLLARRITAHGVQSGI